MSNGSTVVQQVLDSPIKRAYSDRYEYATRVIKTFLSISNESSFLPKKEIEILAVMCVVYLSGGDYMRSDVIIETMEEMRLSAPQIDTMRNYRRNIKRKGWIRGRELRPELMKALDMKGICIGIFLKNGKA